MYIRMHGTGLPVGGVTRSIIHHRRAQPDGIGSMHPVIKYESSGHQRARGELPAWRVQAGQTGRGRLQGIRTSAEYPNFTLHHRCHVKFKNMHHTPAFSFFMRPGSCQGHGCGAGVGATQSLIFFTGAGAGV